MGRLTRKTGKWVPTIDQTWGFPNGSSSKESTCNAEDMGLILVLGRSPGGGNGKPLQYSWLENPMDRGTWHSGGCKESDTTEHMMDGWTDGPNTGSHAHTLEGGMVGPRSLRMPSMAPMWLWGSLWNTELTIALFPEGECPRTSCPLWNWINLSRSTSTQQLSKRIIYNKKNPKPWNTKPMSITK